MKSTILNNLERPNLQHEATLNGIFGGDNTLHFFYSLLNSNMKRINLYDFYLLASELGALRGLKAETALKDAWYPLFLAEKDLRMLLFSGNIELRVSVATGEKLLSAIKTIIDSDPSPYTSTKPINQTSLNTLTSALYKFEQVLSEEFVYLPTYFIPSIGIYSTHLLLDRAEAMFSEEIQAKLPLETVKDIQEAGKCLALNIPTAAAFHIFRATEQMIVEYGELMNVRIKNTKHRNWGTYHRLLSKAPNADPAILRVIDQIREFHRNPLIHPGEFIDIETLDDILSLCKSLIREICKKLPTPPPQIQPSTLLQDIMNAKLK